MSFLLVGSALVAGIAAQSSVSTATNPIKTASSQFLGYRNSTNTQSLRDLGFSGKIGNTWILSFGDAVGTKDIYKFNVNADNPQDGGVCSYITARAGGGLMGDNPLSYSDIVTITNVGGCGSVPQMGYFCPLLSGEQEFQGLGITGVVETGVGSGIIYTRPTVNATNLSTPGAGVALVSVSSNGTIKCSRPFGRTTWGPDEPTWGQLGAIAGNGDGYTYTYANGYDSQGNQTTTVVLARAKTTAVFDLRNYEYYQGNGQFTKDRIYINQLNENSPKNLGLVAGPGQGSIFWSNYYNAYVYITNGPYDLPSFYAAVAKNPWGPWSPRVLIYTDTYPYPQKTNRSFYEYAAAALPKYFSADGKTIYFAYTRAAYYQGVVKVTFQ